MNVQRAREIAASPTMENVEYNGVRIYIQHVNEENETARIYPLGQPEQEQEVPLRSLSEPSSQVAMDVEQVACRVESDT
ncbi:small acid-soluble spore protein H (minor) [Paenibacillus harenae]|uniref:Small acid-soluble spore protein H (Minor) n=1 Tax=Paenibacillus harenae TaxID=306543 RepID=A0ABT9U4E7_PAEHA|nr:small acid-soluble spore protein H (minor) [Paenibacillus harenae]MDQ0114514.1 small acid-soluble spore protein H (minor) [Paenibacillus harenae]